MEIVVLEPLGIDKSLFLEIANKNFGEDVNITYYDDRREDPVTLIKRSAGADIVVISNIPYGKDVMIKNPNLKMLCVAFTGVDHIDMDYCRANNIAVSNAAGYSNTSVAELVFGLSITVMRKIVSCDLVIRKGGTNRELVGNELSGKKFGIVGLGAIGRTVANIAKAFNCEVYAYNRSPFSDDGIKRVDLDTLLRECDIVSLHVPLTQETKSLISTRELSLMKKSAILINTARGPVVDNRALSDALNSRQIAGAGIDVYDMEPPIPVDYPLLTADNIVLTPHVAYATEESMKRRADIVINNISMWLDGKPQNIVK